VDEWDVTWDLYGIYMGFTWDLHGIYMGCYMGFIWDLRGFNWTYNSNIDFTGEIMGITTGYNDIMGKHS